MLYVHGTEIQYTYDANSLWHYSNWNPTRYFSGEIKVNFKIYIETRRTSGTAKTNLKNKVGG